MQIESRRFEGAAASGLAGEEAFLAAGEPAEGEFRCVDCGYGVVVRNVLPECPMCRGVAWEADDPFAIPSA